MSPPVCWRTGSTGSWGQAAAPSCCASLIPSPHILFFLPLWGPGVVHRRVPSDGPFLDVSSCLLVTAALPQACVGLAMGVAYWHPPWGTPQPHPNPLTYTPNPHWQQNPGSQGFQKSHCEPFFWTSKIRKRNGERPKHALPRHLRKLQQLGC